MNRFRILAYAFVGLGCALIVRADDAPPLPPATPVPDQATLDKEFEKTMSGATLSGSFTVDGRQDAAAQGREVHHHESEQASRWVLAVSESHSIRQARCQPGASAGSKMGWRHARHHAHRLHRAGFGKFTCRIMIYDDQYVGTWNGGDHGGKMFGRVLHDANTTGALDTEQK